jgi:hypothetical protein
VGDIVSILTVFTCFQDLIVVCLPHFFQSKIATPISFVQSGDDIGLLQAELEKRFDNPADSRRMAIIAKIET